MNLYDTLTEYCRSDAYPFHMPGHKRRAAFLCDPASIDITEIDGFDDLHHARGLLKEAQERASSLYGSSETHFLVNGSTGGILSAIGACASPGGCLLMSRTSHRSAFNAAALNRLRTAYLYPEQPARASDPDCFMIGADPADVSGCFMSSADPARSSGCFMSGADPARSSDCFMSCADPAGPVRADKVEEALNRLDDVCAVFVTSPTYEGVVSDIEKIAFIAHRHGIPLIVDEAHGAHFGMHPIFPESSVKLGADLVIHSLHKTLPALTQTALIHVNGPLIDREKLRYLLSVYQTSSPSYVLMASIDQCICLLREKGRILFDAYAGRLQRFYEKTRLSSLSFLHTDDPSRILIHPPGSAMHLGSVLRERFHLEPEMTGPSCVLMLSSVCDDDEGLSRLSKALLTLDGEYKDLADAFCGTASTIDPADAVRGTASTIDPADAFCGTASTIDTGALPADVYCTIAQAMDSKSEAVSFSASEGRVSAEFLMLYPPGVPILVPGERISKELISFAMNMYMRGYSLQGTSDYSLKLIRVMI